MSRIDGKYWDESWNPIKTADGHYHCTKCSPGCLKCWAEKINLRAGGKPYDDSPAEFVFAEKTSAKIGHPKPKIFFVCDLCDMFHSDIGIEILDKVFTAACKADQHKFLLLTKRPDNAMQYHFTGRENWHHITGNIWQGVSVCVESELDKIVVLRKVPAFHRWVSFGPLLGQVGQVDLSGIEWVVLEAESDGPGPGRECHWAWMLNILSQAKQQGVPAWVKQINYRNRLIRNIEELPAELRIREYPDGLD